VVCIPDIITCANFGDDQLMDLGGGRDQILLFCIALCRRPYKHLTTRSVLIKPVGAGCTPDLVLSLRSCLINCVGLLMAIAIISLVCNNELWHCAVSYVTFRKKPAFQ